jgi:tRNA threonylcarbamoyladenosine biosynthesis protein TsaB
VTARLLAIDTTTEFGSLALVNGGQIVEDVLLHASDGFGHVLYPQLEQLLSRNGWKLGDIDCFAGASGPGSFTGIRVGLAAVKGLAEALGKLAVAVSNLQALAFHGSAALRATVLDARRGEIYGAVYSASLDPVLPEVVTKFPAWLAMLPEGELEFVGTDFEPFRPALAGTRFEHARVTQAPRALSGAVGLIAAGRFAEGLAQAPAEIDANYVRRSDAELLWKDHR